MSQPTNAKECVLKFIVLKLQQNGFVSLSDEEIADATNYSLPMVSIVVRQHIRQGHLIATRQKGRKTVYQSKEGWNETTANSSAPQ